MERTKMDFPHYKGQRLYSTAWTLDYIASSYRISYPLTLGVGRDLSRLATGCNWVRREDAVEGD